MKPHQFRSAPGVDVRQCYACHQFEDSRFIPESCEGDPRDKDFPGPELAEETVTAGYVDVEIETTDSPDKFEDLFDGCDVELKLKIRGIEIEVKGFKAEEVPAQHIDAIQAAGRKLFQIFYCPHKDKEE